MGKFRDWFDAEWLDEGEAPARGMYRLILATDTSEGTVRKALRGEGVGTKAAARLAGVTGLPPACFAWPGQGEPPAASEAS